MDGRERCKAARIEGRTVTTKGDLTTALILRALASPASTPWVSTDSAYGQDSHFRYFLG